MKLLHPNLTPLVPEEDIPDIFLPPLAQPLPGTEEYYLDLYDDEEDENESLEMSTEQT